MSDTNDQPPTPPEESTRETGARRLKIIAAGFFLFFLLLWALFHLLNRALSETGSAEIGKPKYRVVQIEPGSTVSEIAATLAEQGVISNPLLFKIAAALRGSTRDLKAGEYRFDRSMSLMEVLAWLEQGHVTLHTFTVPEGFTLKQIARLLEQKELADNSEFLRLSSDPGLCEELGLGGPNLEGFLFPDTYKIARGMPVERVIRVMVDRFWSVCSGELAQSVAASDLTLREIVTIASIVEKEAIFDDEKSLIAGVIFNRLKRNMPLQCDVTLRYPLDNYGIHLTYADLKMDSPYNSYLNRGLPPTPICSPGLSSLESALNPAETEHHYFVSMNNGRHKFSTTLAEHNKAVFRYQILNERG